MRHKGLSWNEFYCITIWQIFSDQTRKFNYTCNENTCINIDFTDVMWLLFVGAWYYLIYASETNRNYFTLFKTHILYRWGKKTRARLIDSVNTLVRSRRQMTLSRRYQCFGSVDEESILSRELTGSSCLDFPFHKYNSTNSSVRLFCRMNQLAKIKTEWWSWMEMWSFCVGALQIPRNWFKQLQSPRYKIIIKHK